MFDIRRTFHKINFLKYSKYFSLGYAYDSDCIYVNGTGEDEYEFYIQLNRCGTLGGSDHHKKRNANTKNRDPTVSLINVNIISYF